MSGLVLGLPSKGRLMEQVQEAFADAGLALTQGGRAYAARLPALPGAEVRLMSASDVAAALRSGDVHAGVTGEDLLREQAGGGPLDPVALVRALGFGRADLVVAAPAAWLDVTTVADLADVAAEVRARTGQRLRVATKYLALTRSFFAAHGFGDYRLVESLGATEGAPAAGAADAIVDITTTGATLAANGLKPLVDGLILASQAQLAVSLAAAWTPAAAGQLERLLATLEARARAKAFRLLRAARVGAEAAAALAALGCRPVGEDAAEWSCPAVAAPEAAALLVAAGAGPVRCLEPEYLFDAPVEGYVRVSEAIAARMTTFHA